MIIQETEFPGLFIIEPKVFHDSRGYFFESFHQNVLKKHTGSDFLFVQHNQSYSQKHVLRGLHFQVPPMEQTKLVRVLNGEIQDIAIDIRAGSSTYGKYFSIILSATNKKQLLIPKGFAHGFLVVSDTAEVFYLVDNLYSATHESGILFNDTDLQIKWETQISQCIVSEKDKCLHTFAKLETPFHF
ncbi:MAG: dTDP-4-dehydrorhamnose 3,5-epimerase [Chitinophagaceae bacterium]|nr:dTDP-4-dehydrorhamnose 3,5-epimerase [Chitinophagaceae bacterium]